MPFGDRLEAGRVLATKLDTYANRPDVLVLALPRGGVPVGFEVARALNAPMDVFLVRKLGVPGQPELAMGAIASGGASFVNEEVVRALGITEDELRAVASKEMQELERRERAYRDDRPPPDVRDKTVILIDDGLATGSSMMAAVAALRQEHPERIVVAVPVAARATCDQLATQVDDVVCAMTPEPFMAVGLWYEEFGQTTDDEVRDLLQQATQEHAASQRP
jgi:putative phosphoribosyl transferase